MLIIECRKPLMRVHFELTDAKKAMIFIMKIDLTVNLETIFEVFVYV